MTSKRMVHFFDNILRRKKFPQPKGASVDVSDIFIFFLLGGRGRGSSRPWEGGGGRFVTENPRRGGGLLGGGGEGGRGREGLCEEFN